jgi:hypothetical protein
VKSGLPIQALQDSRKDKEDWIIKKGYHQELINQGSFRGGEHRGPLVDDFGGPKGGEKKKASQELALTMTNNKGKRIMLKDAIGGIKSHERGGSQGIVGGLGISRLGQGISDRRQKSSRCHFGGKWITCHEVRIGYP